MYVQSCLHLMDGALLGCVSFPFFFGLGDVFFFCFVDDLVSGDLVFSW